MALALELQIFPSSRLKLRQRHQHQQRLVEGSLGSHLPDEESESLGDPWVGNGKFNHGGEFYRILQYNDHEMSPEDRQTCLLDEAFGPGLKSLRINPPIDPKEARDFLYGLEAGLFQVEGNGFIPSPLRPPRIMVDKLSASDCPMLSAPSKEIEG